MVKFGLRVIILLGSILFLSSCFGPETPQEVSKAFWEAVINNDVGDVVKYSTLTDAKSYDAFSKDWQGYQPTWGRVTIDKDAANVVSEFTKSSDADHGHRKFITYLVKRNGEWLVDYKRTNIAAHGGVLGSLFDKLGQFSDDLSNQLNSSADDFKKQMDQMSRELEEKAKSFGDEAAKSIDKYAEKLRNSIQELEDSINRALKDDDNLSDHDRHVLRVAADDLDQNRENLEKPSVEAIYKSTRSVADTHQQLETVNSDSVDKYKPEWRDLTRKIEDQMRNMLDELSAQFNGDTT